MEPSAQSGATAVEGAHIYCLLQKKSMTLVYVFPSRRIWPPLFLNHVRITWLVKR